MKKIPSIVSSIALLFSASVFAAPVNINTASAEQISNALNGIGMRKAEAIIEYREKHGKFKQAADVIQVKGIGESTYQKNKADILVK